MDPKTGSLAPGKPQIVIVEDEPAVRRSLQLLLRGQGFDVRAFASAETSTAEGVFGNPDCLVADYKLERLDGIALLSRLREEGWQGPAVLVTAFPSVELAERARASGYAAVFEKPLRERSLTEAIWRLVAWTDGSGSSSDAGPKDSCTGQKVGRPTIP
jgi:FixJ family two-component response regulator